jgi:hypothetical protein
VKASPRGLLDAGRIALPRRMAVETFELLREAGGEGDERMVVWGANREESGSQLVCRTIYVPEQVAVRTEDGLAISIDAAALRELARSLNQRGEVLAVQVHTHPGAAYHSIADDRLAVATTLGALSIVVPNFALGGSDALGEWAVYRRLPDGWSRVSVDDVLELR